MRLTLLAAAALCLAAPAAAQQPDPDSIGLGVFQQILANQGDVQDYTLVLAHGPIRMPVYLYREGEQWKSRLPEEFPLGEMLAIGVMWPEMASEVVYGDEDVMGPDGEARYAGTETVGGRRAHVVEAGFDASEDLPDSMRLYVDVETGQLLRLSMSAAKGDEDDGGISPLAGDLRVTIDLADYTTRDGLTLPVRMRLNMAADFDLSAEDLQRGRAEMARARAELEGVEGAEAAQMRVMMGMMEDLLLRGEVELAVQVEDVRVNSGPPAWLESDEQR